MPQSGNYKLKRLPMSALSESRSSHLAHRLWNKFAWLQWSHRLSSSSLLNAVSTSSTRSSSVPPRSPFLRATPRALAIPFQQVAWRVTGSSKKSSLGTSSAREYRWRKMASRARPNRSTVARPNLSASTSDSGVRSLASSTKEGSNQPGTSYARASSMRRIGERDRAVRSSMA